MLSPKVLIGLFFGSCKQENAAETLIDADLSFLCASPQSSSRDALSSYLATIVNKDCFRLTIAGNGQKTYDTNGNADSQEDFFLQWEELCRRDSADNFKVELHIDKRNHDTNVYFVYDIKALYETLSSLDHFDFISAISDVARPCAGMIYFLSVAGENGFSTKTIRFITSIDQKKSVPVIEKFDREKIVEKLKGVGHFSGINDCVALPEDFELVDEAGLSDILVRKINECCFISTLAAIYDIAALNEDTLSLKLNGYKTINLTHTLSALQLKDLPAYLSIYHWILSGGSLQDKIGLVRNMVSLNLGVAPNFTLSDNTYSSILSGYKVYEKQNIKQYIELRNKMSDQLIGFNEKAGKIADNFAANFQKSALAVATLYASLIIGKVLSSDNPINAFSLGTAIISIAFLLVSLLYYFVSRADINRERIRFIASYENMKKRNEDLLQKDDIDRILNKDIEHLADLNYIDDKRKRFSQFWIWLLLIFFSATIILTVLNFTAVKTVKVLPRVIIDKPVKVLIDDSIFNKFNRKVNTFTKDTSKH